MQISLDQARAFCKVVECGGYSRASEELNKSHPALVYLIKMFEQQCGFELFDRKGYRNTLTGQGQLAYHKCKELLQKEMELETLCDSFRSGWEPSLKIIYDGILPFAPFYRIYSKFQKDKVPTVIQTYAHYLDDVEKAYIQLNADIMISVFPVKNSALKSFPLKELKNILVAHKNHLINADRKKIWTIDELKEFSFLTVRASGAEIGLNTREFDKSASFFFSDFAVKKEAILKGVGFGWLPEHLIASELKRKTLLPIKWERASHHRLEPVVYFSKAKSSGPALKIVLEFLKTNEFI
ncbi:MAG: LysR family transcriptional regulator [Bdellovibrionaceae bacterium]|nr:LysR family transcriptional regulator [Pseudobdellovibrionaceae bacterium]